MALFDLINGDNGVTHIVGRDSFCDCHPADPSARFDTRCGVTIRTGHNGNRALRRYRESVTIDADTCPACVATLPHCPTCTCHLPR